MLWVGMGEYLTLYVGCRKWYRRPKEKAWGGDALTPLKCDSYA